MILQHPLVVTNIAQETFKTMFSKPEHSGSQKEINEIPNVVQNLHELHLSESGTTAFQGETESKNCKESSENVHDIWLNRFHILKQREASLRLKELAIGERERTLAKKEKQVTLLDRVTKEKMTRADIYLRQCREVRSVTSSVKNLRQQQRYSSANADLDTSLSADPGDTSVLPTSTKLYPEYITKPSPFARGGSERRVHFGTLPITKPKAKYSSLQLATNVPQFIHPPGDLPSALRVSTKVLGDIPEHVPSKLSEVHDSKEKLQKKRVKSSFHDLQRAEMDNLQNNVLTVLNSNKYVSRSSNTIVRPPPRTTSWLEDRTLWLENKRHSYVLGSLRAPRSTKKENAQPQEQRVTRCVGLSAATVSSAPRSAVALYSSFR